MVLKHVAYFHGTIIAKCLGKRTKPQKSELTDAMRSLITIEQFNHIVGIELLQKYEKIEDVLKEGISP